MNKHTLRALFWLLYLLSLGLFCAIWWAMWPTCLLDAVVVAYGSLCVFFGVLLAGLAGLVLADMAMEERRK